LSVNFAADRSGQQQRGGGNKEELAHSVHQLPLQTKVSPRPQEHATAIHIFMTGQAPHASIKEGGDCRRFRPAARGYGLSQK
jgi:hypothetical protein